MGRGEKKSLQFESTNLILRQGGVTIQAVWIEQSFDMVLEMGVVSYGCYHGSNRTCILNHASH